MDFNELNQQATQVLHFIVNKVEHFSTLAQIEQICYAATGLGLIFVVVGVILLII